MSASMLTGVLVVDGEAISCETTRLTIDESWTPHVQAEVVIPWTSTRAAALKPTVLVAPRAILHLTRSWGRPGIMADLTAAWVPGSVADITAAIGGLSMADLTDLWSDPWTNPAVASAQLVADLIVTATRVDVRAATITVSLMSDEALAQGARVNTTFVTTTRRARVAELLNAAGCRVGESDLTSIPLDPIAPQWLFPTQSVWDHVADLLAPVGVRIWCDESRRWHSATDAITTPGTTVLTGVTDLSVSSSRDSGWAAAVYVCFTGQVTDADGTTDNRSYVWSAPDVPDPRARAAAVTTALGAVPYTDWPPSGSYVEAQARLARLASLAETIEVTAVADPTIRPGSVVTTAAPLPVVSGVASAVTWSLPADTVTIATRTEV